MKGTDPPRKYCSPEILIELAWGHKNGENATVLVDKHEIELWYLKKAGNITTCRIARVNISSLSRGEAWAFIEGLDKAIPKEKWEISEETT